ncbi:MULTISPECIES: hypothetical protein [unclassified Marinitoga]|nr:MULTISPECIES: hypothetical protein [unclassified Marinitoga]
MLWIIEPINNDENIVEGCGIDWCGNWCFVQNCTTQDCSKHICVIYVH